LRKRKRMKTERGKEREEKRERTKIERGKEKDSKREREGGGEGKRFGNIFRPLVTNMVNYLTYFSYV
jgi:hypothetical protein